MLTVDVEMKLAAGRIKLPVRRRQFADVGAAGDRDFRHHWRTDRCPGVHLVGHFEQRGYLLLQRPTVGDQDHARQRGQRGLFERCHVLVTQQVKASTVAAGKAVFDLLQRAVAQAENLTLNWHQVGIDFTVENHQISGDSAKAPQRLSLKHSLHQRHAAAGMDAHQHDGFITRQTEAPKMALVYQRTLRRWSSRRIKKRGIQVLQCGIFFRVHAHVAQAHLRHCCRHAVGALDVHRLQIFVDARDQFIDGGCRCGGKRQACQSTGRNADLHAQPGNRVKPVYRRAVGHLAVRQQRRVRRLAVTAQKRSAVGDEIDLADVRVRVGEKMCNGHRGVAMETRLARHQQRTPLRVPVGL